MKEKSYTKENEKYNIKDMIKTHTTSLEICTRKERTNSLYEHVITVILGSSGCPYAM